MGEKLSNKILNSNWTLKTAMVMKIIYSRFLDSLGKLFREIQRREIRKGFVKAQKMSSSFY